MQKLIKCDYFFIIMLLCGILIKSTSSANQEDTIDLTVVSSIDFNGSVRRHAIGLIECLNGHLKINFIPSRPVNLDEVNDEVKKVILASVKKPGKVALLEDPLWYADAIPKNSKVKIAFSVFESTKIPQEWVQILNSKFDAVIVADEFYIKVYEDSGVKIPVFHIPLGIYIEEFLEKPLKNKANKPFVFKCCSRFFKRKNHQLLITAFAREFGNRKDVKLKINGGGKWGSEKIYEKLKALVKKLRVANVYLTNDALPWNEYIENMSAMDCYVNISQGEGFSITPRESLALGIPTIVTNNTAQKTICATNLVRAVPSNIRIPALCRAENEPVGYQFNCRLADVQAALRDVYDNYEHYLEKAHRGREWVKQYRWADLRQKYLNLIKPKIIKLGKVNEVTDEYFMTNSKELYQKYLEIQEPGQVGKGLLL
jgi:glycosyltransferase involved in cell wall biosynthesis